MKEIIIRMFEPSDFQAEEELRYMDHSWLEVEMDGEIQKNLSSVSVTADALTAQQFLFDWSPSPAEISFKKVLRR